MTTHTELPKTRDRRSVQVVTALVSTGLLDAGRQHDATVVVDRVLVNQEAPESSLRGRLAELAGYVGGAFVVCAVALFLADQWGGLSAGQQVGLVAGIGIILAVAGAGIGVTGGGFTALRGDSEAVRRRLAGVLFAGASLALAAAIAKQLELMGFSDSATGTTGALVLTLAASVGYLLEPTVVGQLSIVTGACVAIPFLLDLVTDDVGAVPAAPLVLALGVVWLVLAEGGLLREIGSARVIGCALAIFGAQVPVFDSSNEWVGYLLTVLVAAAAFAGYVVRRAWPYLAAGVIGVTLAVPEALIDWTDGSLGPAGVLLVSGVTLLAACLLGLRLRKEVTEDSAAAAR